MLISTDADLSVTEVLSVVADPTRWRILQLLADEELCASHLQHALGIGQTLVSHHMKALREAGLLETAPCGRFTYYRLRPGALDACAEALASIAQAGRHEPRRRPC